jgi:hypothetical protein
MAGLILTTILIIAWTIALVWLLARLGPNRLERRKIIGSVLVVHLVWWAALHGVLTLALRIKETRAGLVGLHTPDNDPKWKKAAQDYFDKNGPLCPSRLFSVPLVPLMVAVSEDNYWPKYTRGNRILCKRVYHEISIYLLVFKIPLLLFNYVEDSWPADDPGPSEGVRASKRIACATARVYSCHEKDCGPADGARVLSAGGSAAAAL